MSFAHLSIIHWLNVFMLCQSRWQSQMQQLRDMGIQDEELMLRALQATDGDIQAALELIFAGGPGLWAHTLWTEANWEVGKKTDGLWSTCCPEKKTTTTISRKIDGVLLFLPLLCCPISTEVWKASTFFKNLNKINLLVVFCAFFPSFTLIILKSKF